MLVYVMFLYSSEEEVPSDSSGIDTLSPLSSPTRLRTSDSESMDKIMWAHVQCNKYNGIIINTFILFFLCSSPYSDMLSDISVSQCGLSDDITDQSFASSQISFSEFCANPELLANSNTILRINGRYAVHTSCGWLWLGLVKTIFLFYLKFWNWNFCGQMVLPELYSVL